MRRNVARFKAAAKNRSVKHVFGWIAGMMFLIAMFTSILVWWYSNGIMQEFYIHSLNEYQRNVLTSMERSARQFPKMVIQMFDDPAVVRYLAGKPVGGEEKIIALDKIRMLMAHNNVEDMRVINEKADTIWVSDTVISASYKEYKKQQPGLEKILELWKQGSNFIDAANFSGGGEEQGLYYVYSNYLGYTFVLKLNKNEYRKSILRAYVPAGSQSWIFYHGALSLTDGPGTGELSLQLGECKEKMQAGKYVKRGDTIYVFDQLETKFIVTALPYTMFREAISENLSFLWLIVAAIMFLCLISVIVYDRYISIMRKSYRAQLLHGENRFAQSALPNTMYKLFTGNFLCLEEKQQLQAVMRRDGVKQVVPLLVVVDEYGKLQQNTQQDDCEMMKYGVCNICEEVLSALGKIYTISLEKAGIGILICSGEEIERNQLVQSIRSAAENVARYFTTTLSVVAGEAREDILQIGQTIRNLYTQVNYCFITGYGSVVTAENIPAANPLAEYPMHLQHQIVNALKSRDEAAFTEAREAFVQYVEENNYTKARGWGILLYVNAADALQFSRAGELSMINNEYTDIDSMDRIFEYLHQQGFAKTGFREDAAKDEFGEKAVQLIAENYQNSSYGIADLAEAFHINPVYAGQKFKNCMDQSFNTYLNRHRCQKAAELLAETDKKSVEIAELCGFTSDTYFTSSFKKYFEITPKQYRRLYQKKQESRP